MRWVDRASGHVGGIRTVELALDFVDGTQRTARRRITGIDAERVFQRSNGLRAALS